MKKNATTQKTQEEIVRLLDEMSGMSVEDVGYSDRLKTVVTLTELLPKKERKPVSADTIFSSIVNLISIGSVLHYEKLNVVTSKAFSWIKPVR